MLRRRAAFSCESRCFVELPGDRYDVLDTSSGFLRMSRQYSFRQSSSIATVAPYSESLPSAFGPEIQNSSSVRVSK
jgi:hypothetical protein